MRRGTPADAVRIVESANSLAMTEIPCSRESIISHSAGERCQAQNPDRILFDLAPGWAVGFDRLQWIVFHAIARKAGDRRSRWRPVAYVSSEKRILERIIHEKRIRVTQAGRHRLNALPERFSDFCVRDQQSDQTILPV